MGILKAFVLQKSGRLQYTKPHRILRGLQSLSFRRLSIFLPRLPETGSVQEVRIRPMGCRLTKGISFLTLLRR